LSRFRPLGTGLMIESLGSYLPERSVSTEEVVAGCAVPLKIPLEKLTGIRSRRVAAAHEFTIELARNAIEDCLRHSRHDRRDFDLLICGSISHFESAERLYAYEPSAATRLKNLCGLDRAIALDLTNGCAGLWTGIVLAEALIANGTIERALIASGEYCTDLTRTAQQEIRGFLDPQIASLTVGDSGVALTLEAGSSPDAGFQALDLYTLGGYSKYCLAGPTTREHGGAVMLTNSLRIGPRCIEHGVPHLEETLRDAGWTADDVDHLIPHQTSETTLLDALKKINLRLSPASVPLERYRINLAERANTGTSTHFLAVHDAVSRGEINTGDRAVFCITGSGLSIGTALYTFDDLPDRLRNGHTPGNGNGQTKQKRSERASPGLMAPAAGISAIGLVRGDDAKGLDTVELCRRAGESCLARGGRSPREVEAVIHSGVYRSGYLAEPAMAALAAGALDLNAEAAPDSPTRTLAFDVLAGHLGTLKACWVADQMIRAGRCDRVMVLASDVENNAGGEFEPYGLESAGSAMLVDSSGQDFRFELFHFRDYPDNAGDLESYVWNPDGRSRLVVRRRPDFESNAGRNLAITARELLESLGLTLAHFELVVPPAGLPELESTLVRELSVGKDSLLRIAAEGDLLGSSLAISLHELQRDGRMKPGSRALVLAAGSGGQTGCAILRFG
jgi:3-oxoacyl-[acyl-carrier-protein] synthase III